MMIDRDGIARPGTPERRILDEIRLEALPRHVAVIMDGNGRWAKGRNLTRVQGHRAGALAVRTILETAARLGIEVITLYAFSTENWKRPTLEVRALWTLLKEFIDSQLETFKKNNLRFQTIGDLERLEPSVRKCLDRARHGTRDCTGTLVQIALNYSGRHELSRVIRDAVADAGQGQLKSEAIDEDWINRHLDTAGTPDPDLLIRTSGEQRVSNFLLWQIAYSEIYFTDVLWPDFGVADFLKALRTYQQRDRRFGGLGPESSPGTQTHGGTPVQT